MTIATRLMTRIATMARFAILVSIRSFLRLGESIFETMQFDRYSPLVAVCRMGYPVRKLTPIDRGVQIVTLVDTINVPLIRD